MSAEDVRALAAEYWDLTLAAQPTSATLRGDHRFDDATEDHSEAGENALREKRAALLERVQRVDGSVLEAQDAITARLLDDLLTREIEQVDARLRELTCDAFTGAHASPLRAASQVTLTAADQAPRISQRYRKLGQYLDANLDRLRAGVAKGRTPVAINVARSVDQIDGYLDTPLEDDVFLNTRAPPDMDEAGERSWRAQLEEIVRNEVRPAFARYRDGLADDVLPHARPTDRCGLAWISDGEAVYATQIARHTTLDLPAEAIHRAGLDEIESALPEEYAAAGERALGSSDLESVLERLRADAELRFGGADEIRSTASAVVARAQEAIPGWFGVLPGTACVVKEVPAFLAKDVPPAYYSPPAQDGSRPGTYFVNTHEPETKNRFEAEAVAFHEAIPGHHLQIAIAAELDDLPEFRRHGLITAYVEGWGLYAERLADEMGLYTAELDRLGMLSAASWRAARLVLDTGIHALGWNRDQAIAFFAKHTPVAAPVIEVEVDRYIGMPGQALAYRTGQRELFRVRDRARERLGPRFDIRGFHDAVLTSGPVTLPILEDLVDAWVDTHE